MHAPIPLEMQVAPTSVGSTPVLDEAAGRKHLTALKAVPPVPSKAAVAAVARPSVAGGPPPKSIGLPSQPCSPRGPPPKRHVPADNTVAKIARLTGPAATPKRSSPVNRNLEPEFEAVSGEKSRSSLVSGNQNPVSEAMTGHGSAPPKASPIAPSVSPALSPTVLESSHLPSEAARVIQGETRMHLFCFNLCLYMHFVYKRQPLPCCFTTIRTEAVSWNSYWPSSISSRRTLRSWPAVCKHQHHRPNHRPNHRLKLQTTRLPQRYLS